MQGLDHRLNPFGLSKFDFFSLLIVLAVAAIMLSYSFSWPFNIFAQNTTEINGSQADSSMSIAVSTDKFRYLAGELVKLEGTVSNGSSSALSEKIIIKVNYVANTSKLPSSIAPPESDKDHIVYNASVYSVNNSFSVSILDTFRSGTYQASATLARGMETASSTFQVESPFFTIFALVIYAGAVLLVIFLIVLLRGSARVSFIQIANFVFLSGIVAAITVALLVGDVELGPNSPVGLVMQSSGVSEESATPSEKQVVEQNSWVINIGGTQDNNYSNGIQIPVYVFVLGLWGGYLRYLYETATTVRKTLERESKRIEDHVDNLEDERIEEMEITVGRFEHIPRETRLALVASPGDDAAREEKRRAKRYVMKIRLERRSNLFQSLKNLALLLLAPLLSMAIWLLLVQAGVGDTSQEEDENQSGLFILAAISITVGLVTNEAIQLLVNFAKDRFGRVEEEAAPNLQLSFDISDLKNPISRGQEQKITIAVFHEESAVEGAIVKGRVKHESGKAEHTFSGLTDSSGKYSHSWKVEETTDIGTYNVRINISADGYRDIMTVCNYNVS